MCNLGEIRAFDSFKVLQGDAKMYNDCDVRKQIIAWSLRILHQKL